MLDPLIDYFCQTWPFLKKTQVKVLKMRQKCTGFTVFSVDGNFPLKLCGICSLVDGMMYLDHFAISASSLSLGQDYVETELGVSLAPGGSHALFGTHNMLLRLGDVYLEVIAPDPDAAPPSRPRWFGLDEFHGRPRITNWICRTDRPSRCLGRMLPGTGEMLEVSRDDLTWEITVSPQGTLPLSGFAPAIINWRGAPSAAERLPDTGCRLKKLIIKTPHAITLRSTLSLLFSDRRVEIKGAEVASYQAIIETPSGERTLG